MRISIPKTIRGQVAVFTSLILIVVAIVSAVVISGNSVPKNAAFKVNGKPITIAAVNKRIDVMKAMYGLEPPKSGKKLDAFRRDSAKSVAVAMVISAAADKRSIVVADKAASDSLTKLIDDKYADQGREGFIQALGQMGASEAQVLDEIRQQMVLSRLFDSVTAGVKVSDSDVAAAFKKRKAQLDAPEQRTVSNIVVDTKDSANAVMTILAKGKKFPDVAKKYSLDSATSKSGGALGAVTEDQLDPVFGKPAFKAKTGVPFGPIKTTHGWNIGIVSSISPAVPATFSNVKVALKSALEEEKAVSIWRKWLQKAIKNADIKYADAYRPKHPHSLPPAPSLAAPSANHP